LALSDNTTGNGNIGIGFRGGWDLTTGHGNIDIGNEGVAGEANTIRLGQDQTATYIAGIAGAATMVGSGAVYVDSDGKLGTIPSARRFKRDIQPMENASEAILALKPVRFHYKNDVKGIPCFGLVAEDVEKVNPHLVVRDKNGELLSVRYEQINAMFLNEFLKAHRTVQEQKAIIAQLKSTDAKQEATIAKQQKQIEALTAGLQKVSAQLEASKPAPQVVNNP